MGYRDLIIWKKSKTLAVNIYKFTDYLRKRLKNHTLKFIFLL